MDQQEPSLLDPEIGHGRLGVLNRSVDCVQRPLIEIRMGQRAVRPRDGSASHRQGPKVVLEILILLYHFDYAIHLFGQFCVALLRLLLHEALESPEPELRNLALLSDLLLQPREKLRLQHHSDEPLPRIKSIKCKVADYSENAPQLVLVRCSRARGSQNQVHQ